MIVQTRNGARGVVVPTMPEPNIGDFFANMDITGYEKAMKNWRQHLSSLPLIPLPEELSHLKDGEEVKGWSPISVLPQKR